jgi:NAD(P)H-hydrate epimerase
VDVVRQHGAVIPVVTPAEMAAIDAAAPEPVEELVERAGAATARAALDLLGGAYGRRVVVVAGKGNNGADGRSAARRLEQRGVRVEVLDAARLPAALPSCDLLVDAAFGTGFRGTWEPPPAPPGAPVLAIDIPTGIDGLTGVERGSAWTATRTITFAALKPGLLLGAGPERAGEVTVADIGLDTTSARTHLVEGHDVAAWIPDRDRDAHKWRAACWIVAGSPGMTGAAHLAARGAQRSGAGYVRLSIPGVDHDPLAPTEVVGVALPARGWAAKVLADLDRVRAVAVGPGLGPSSGAAAQVRAVVGATERPPLVVDGDGLTALADDVDGRLTRSTSRRPRPATVLTPHDGELARLGADVDDADRIAVVRALAARRGAVVLAKGPTTVVAGPGGDVLLTTTGDARLATAGTGDVLTGILAGFLAQGVEPPQAAAAAAHVHGRAGALAWRRGLVAGDVADHVPQALSELPEE